MHAVGEQMSDAVAPHAGVVALANPYAAGLATISFSSANELSRMVGTLVASMPANRMLL